MNKLIFLLFFSLFFVRGLVSLDPDFGFRLRTGQLILSQGFPKTDPYSYTMPSYSYVEHAWLVAVFWAVLLPIITKVGLALITSILAISAILISASIGVKKGLRSLKYDFFPVFLASSFFLAFFGIRAQIVSWFMFCLLFKILFDEQVLERWKLALPALFLVWANLHGSFAAGLMILSLTLIVRWVRGKRFKIYDLLVVAASWLSTLINPYGFGAFKEVWSSVSDASLRWRISEWKPGIFSGDFSLALFSTLSIFLVIKYRKKIALEKVVLYCVLFFLGLSSARHLPIWLLLALPMTIESFDIFYLEIKKIKGAAVRYQKALKFAFIGAIIVFIFQSFFSLRGALALNEEFFYPKEAVAYLRHNHPKGQIFSEYGWGGYLIWKLPEKKVFIDGRMPSWRQSSNLARESANAMQDYLDLLDGKVSYREVFKNYNIDTVLWPSPKKKSYFDILSEKLFHEKDFDFPGSLIKTGWIITYQDEVSTVYRKLGF